MGLIDHAKAELAAINFGEDDSRVMVELLDKFLDQWDSGGAVSVVAPVFVRLLNGQPLGPLTGADDEWFDPMGDGLMLQNKRCSSVFKDWRDPETMRLSERAGVGIQLIHDINADDFFAPITFPYDPVTRMPAPPVMTVSVTSTESQEG